MNNKQLLIHGGIFVAGAGIGFGVGYLVYKKKFQKLAEEEIESVRKSYVKAAQAKPDIDDLRNTPAEQTAEAAHNIVVDNAYASQNHQTDAMLFYKANGRAPSTEELIEMSSLPLDAEERARLARDRNDSVDENIPEGDLFDRYNPAVTQDPEDLGQGIPEPSARDKTRPYVISAAEWYANDEEYDQITLTYWADDDVLADDAERTITDVAKVIGESTLQRFGFQSDNPDIVYIRNDELKADYEITRDERNYAQVVHGIDPEEINNSGVPRRMRSNDE